MLATKVQDGSVVKVGDYVCFKSDYEQCGKVTKIAHGMFGGVMLTIASGSDEGFGGDYIGGAETTVQSAEDCWVE
jgi:hypothetical protein